MSEHRSIVARAHEACNAGRLQDLDELLAEDVLYLNDGGSIRGRTELCDFVAGVRREVPGFRVVLEQVLADGDDTIVTLTRYEDTSSAISKHSSQGVWPLPAKRCAVHRIADGRIVEWRNYIDPEPIDQLPDGGPAHLTGVQRLISEQAALRRVATLVARGAAQSEVFDAIVSEASQLFGQETWLRRFEADGTAPIVAQRGAPGAGELVGQVLALREDGVSDRARRTGRPARVDSYPDQSEAGRRLGQRLGVTASAAAPLVVQGTPWGTLLVVSRDSPLAAGIEDRLAQFADLAATAIANAQSRAELESLADEQTALRRVAELVARGAPTREVFDRVTVEASGLLDGNPMTLLRFESSAEAVVVAAHGVPEPAVGGRVPLDGENGPARLWRTGRTVRIDDGYQAVASASEPRWITAGVLTPIVVEGRLWGLLGAPSASPLPAGTEERLARFAGLVAAAIANAESRAALTASRRRIVASADEARRRLARDVHDGAQQRLVHALITLQQAQAALHDPDPAAAELLGESLAQVQAANAQLRELARGILPAALAHGGLRAGVDSLLADIPLPVHAEVLAERLPEPVETTAYFVIAEALTNVTKHAFANRAEVRALVAGDQLSLDVSDDGRGGADPGGGSGLIGLADRVDAAGGSISLTSPPGAGTKLSVALPIGASETPEHR